MSSERHTAAADPAGVRSPGAVHDSVVTPPPLRRGDTVAVVSPCGPVLDHALLDDGIAQLTAWGLRVIEGRHVRKASGHLAGPDAQRLSDLNAAIADPEVRALWITRGGYGMTRILSGIDWAGLAARAKLIVGFSDVTALLVGAWQRVGLVGVHGHFVGRLTVQPAAARERLRAVLFGEDAPVVLAGNALPTGATRAVTAPLIGGNLTVLAALAGTPDAVRAPGCILLVEEVGEAPYRVDRLLTQLRHSGALDGVVGVAVGAAVRCDPPSTRPSGTFERVVADRLGGLGIPVVTGLGIGHMSDQRALLHGGTVTLDGAAGTVTCHDRLEESADSPHVAITTHGAPSAPPVSPAVGVAARRAPSAPPVSPAVGVAAGRAPLAPPNPRAAPDAHDAGADLTALPRLEEAMWRPETRGDRAWMDRHLTADFTEHGRSGRRYTRDETLAVEVGEIDAVLPLADLVVRPLGDRVALITYRSEVGGELANRISVWRWTATGWRLAFHQGAPVER
jgi:muramoyltetrapeptide carboxypeptidase